MGVENKPMTVADLIVRLSEMDPTMEVVTPQAPYGCPCPVYDGFVSEINIDDEILSGVYCGIGFSEKDEYAYCESDDLDNDDDGQIMYYPDGTIIGGIKEEDVVWHDRFVPQSAEDIKKVLNRVQEEFEDTDGYDNSAGEED